MNKEERINFYLGDLINQENIIIENNFDLEQFTFYI